MGRNRREKNVGKRRTVLQLDDGSAYQKEAAFGDLARRADPNRQQGSSNPLRGLLGQYGESDEEHSAEETENGHSEAEVFTESASGDGKPKEKRHTLDSEVANFLAEIDAISTPGEDADDAPQKPEPDGDNDDVAVETPAAADLDGEAMATLPHSSTGIHDNDEDKPEIQPPEVPVTEWQHLLDDSTQAYYFWNTVTNEVTWEIPESYSQYLLRYKEYEEKLERYEILQAQKKARDEKNADRSEEADSTERLEPLVQYSLNEEDEDQETDDSEDQGCPGQQSPQQPDTVYGPELPSSITAFQENSQIGPQLPDSNDTDSDIDGKRMSPSDNDDNVSHGYDDAVDSQDNTQDEFIGPCLPSDGIPLQDALQNGEDGEQIIGPVIGPCNRTQEDFIGPSLPSHEAPDANNVGTSDEVSESSAVKKSSRQASQDSDDLEAYALRELEEPVFTHYEFYNKKYDVVENGDGKDGAVSSAGNVAAAHSAEEEMDDFDDIDRQLEMAFEKKQGDVNPELRDRNSVPVKRGLPEADTEDQAVKKAKSSSSEEMSHEESIKQRRREDIKLKAEVADLSSLINSKLEFLDVSRKGLSKLHILLIQLETRLQDWKEGGLNLRHLLCKLQEADAQLRQYESSAAPPGWSCHWDRMYSRYFYTDNATGESQWDYPSTQEKSSMAQEHDEDSSDSDDSDESSSAADQPHLKAVSNGNHSMVSSTTDEEYRTETVNSKTTFVTSTTAEADQRNAVSAPSSSSALQGEPHVPQQPHNRAPPLPPSQEEVSSNLSTPNPAQLYSMFKAGEPLPPGTEPLINPIPPPPPPEPSEVSSLEGIDLNLPAPPPPPPPDSPPQVESASGMVVGVAPSSPELVDMEIDEHEVMEEDKGATLMMTEPSDGFGDYMMAASSLYQQSAVIARPPQPPSVSSSTPLPAPLPSTLTAPPLYLQTVPSSSGTSTPNQSPPHQAASTDYQQVAALTGHDSTAATASSAPQPPSTVPPPAREKKKKKDKQGKLPSGSLALKKKNLPSLVHRWQQVQQEVVRQTREEEEAAAVQADPSQHAQRQLEKWRKDMIESGEAAYNPNFETVPDDWRERLKQRKKREGT